MKLKIALAGLVLLGGYWLIQPVVQQQRINRRVAELARADEPTRATLVSQLAAEGPAVVAPLVAALPHQDQPAKLATLHVFKILIPDCFALSTAMNCVTGYVAGKKEAVAALDQMLPVLIAALQQPGPEIQLAALEVLGTPRLGHALYRRREDRAQVVSALGKLRNAESAAVRLASVQVAALLPSEDAEALLIAAVADDHFPVRREAALKLVEVVQANGILTTNEPPSLDDVVRTLSLLLDEMARANDPRMLEGQHRLEHQCLDAFAKFNAIDEVRQFLRHPDDGLQLHAAWLLFTLGRQDLAVNAAIRLATNSSVRFQAAQTLAHPSWSNYPLVSAAMQSLKEEDFEAWQRVQQCRR